jgi:hypothetical protein
MPVVSALTKSFSSLPFYTRFGMVSRLAANDTPRNLAVTSGALIVGVAASGRRRRGAAYPAARRGGLCDPLSRQRALDDQGDGR